MFARLRKKLAIKRIQKKIRELELKRSRSMAGLVSSILGKTPIDEVDRQCFDKYTEEIVALREQIRKYNDKG